jgi:DNA polymerase IV
VTPTWPRVIVHADMDAFYAAIEQLDDPTLRGRPVLVGPRSNRGVVLTASYEARPFKVGSAMPMARARRLCPQAIVVPPRFERYQQVSKIVMDVFADFSPSVEALSLDEAFLDMSGAEKIFGSPAKIGKRMKDAVREATGGLTASIGISATKYVAKVASGYGKPDGLTIVPPADARAWLAPQSVASLWGAGPKTELRLRALGLNTIGDVAACKPEYLATVLGGAGRHFYALANAEDPRIVAGSRANHSLGSERTLNVDVTARAAIEQHLRHSAETVGARLRRRGAQARGVRVKLKRTDFRILTRQRVLSQPTDVAADLFVAAQTLLDEFGDQGPFRLVGLAAYDLVDVGDDGQLALPLVGSERNRRLETALDRLAQRYGAGIVQRAGELIGDRGVGVGANLDFLRDEEGEDG